MKYRDPDTGNFVDLYFKTGDTLPIGTIVSYGSLTPPTNWLVCDGSAVSRTTYATLFEVIGTSYGSGDGSTTFNLPDLRGRVPVGKSTDTEFDTLGETGGEKTHTLTVDEIPSHSHELGYSAYSIDLIAGGADKGDAGRGQTPSTPAWNTFNTGGGQAHNNLQPYQVVCYIIKAFQSAGVVANVENSVSDSTTNTYSCDYINDIATELSDLIAIYEIEDKTISANSQIDAGELPNAYQNYSAYVVTCQDNEQWLNGGVNALYHVFLRNEYSSEITFKKIRVICFKKIHS